VSLGLCILRQGRAAEAEPFLREGLSIREENLPPGHWARFHTMSVLGEALARQGRSADAEPLLLSGYEGMEAAQSSRKREARERIRRFYESIGRPDRAAAFEAPEEKAGAK
jgi:hypothetical protein